MHGSLILAYASVSSSGLSTLVTYVLVQQTTIGDDCMDLESSWSIIVSLSVILSMNYQYYKSMRNYFLFSDYFMPGKVQRRADMFNKKWKRVREALGWPRCYQFYSLKDSGIRDLANAEGVVVARDHARHSDVAVNNKYIQQHEAHEWTKHFKGALD